jgi:PKD domain
MRSLFVLGVCVFLLPAATFSQPQTIDFETLPDGSPVTEGMLIHDQYAEWGVTFELVGLAPDVGPKVADVGGAQTAFQGPSRSEPDCGINSNTRADMPAADQGVGCLFLTDDNIHNTQAHTLRVNYITPVFLASGELLDIDVTEIWTVEALDANDQVIASEVFRDGDPGTGEGIATPWSFSLAEPIHAIRLTPDWVTTHNFGLAFDNFSPSSVPDFPICDAGGPYAGDSGVPVQFDGSGSYDPDGEIVSWHWDFGDGEVSDQMAPMHAYSQDGEYVVVLCVTDNDGNRSCCSPDGYVVDTQKESWNSIKAYYR